eukprot:TRINITY_DN21656_c1_g1_i1.p1 TRINITY_DN21656_c1_g1~~TRINITY_DN21656_c1_g1_i1.p1  ORF type:complete len:134 (+),score=11.01 TRINITY_DN21656_c1_g1_i1:47-448(+)
MASSRTGVQEEILKTKMCSFHADGRCSRGMACNFAHDVSELRQKLNFYKSRPCVGYVRKGHCRAGGACRFAHGVNDLRVPLSAEAEKSPSSSGDLLIAEPSRLASARKVAVVPVLKQHTHSCYSCSVRSLPIF